MKAFLRQKLIKSRWGNPLLTAYRRQRLEVQLRSCVEGANRRIQGYCLGAPKTGTTTLGKSLQSCLRAEHEPLAYDFVPRMLTMEDHHVPTEEYLKRRDRYLSLEFESSHFLYKVAGSLNNLFPDAKFIVTIRDCYSWTESLINQRAVTDDDNQFSFWALWARANICSQPLEYSQLKLGDVAFVEQYLRYWATHYESVFTGLDPDRCLLIHIEDLNQSEDRIADFLGIPRGSFLVESKNVRTEKQFRLSSLDQQELSKLVHKICGPLMEKYYPEKLAHLS